MQNEHTEAPNDVPKAQALLCFNALVAMRTSMSREKYKWNHVSDAKSQLILGTMLSESTEGSELLANSHTYHHYIECQWRAVVAWHLYCTYDRPVIFENPVIKETVSRDWERLEMVWINRAKLGNEPYIIYYSIGFFFVTKMSFIFFEACRKVVPLYCTLKGNPLASTVSLWVIWQSYRKFIQGVRSVRRFDNHLINLLKGVKKRHWLSTTSDHLSEGTVLIPFTSFFGKGTGKPLETFAEVSP
jgi:hypothetical protein